MSTVSMTPKFFGLSPELCDQLIAEARATFPRECCGLIEGVRRGETIDALKLHATRNLASEPGRFEIDPAEQFRLLRKLRGTGREIVGCYHSHPGGQSTPSERDLVSAGEEGFVWLIMAVGGDGAWAVAPHYFAEGAFQALRMD